jgi:hypothetical protein
MKYYSHTCRFRISRSLFLRIMRAVEDHDDYLVQKINTANKLRLSCLRKVTAVFRMLCNKVAADTTDEYICIGESRTIESMRRLVIVVVEIFKVEYLRSPNENDITQLTSHCRRKMLLGHASFIDCIHWK